VNVAPIASGALFCKVTVETVSPTYTFHPTATAGAFPAATVNTLLSEV
jgi:hypothetical protein